MGLDARKVELGTVSGGSLQTRILVIFASVIGLASLALSAAVALGGSSILGGGLGLAHPTAPPPGRERSAAPQGTRPSAATPHVVSATPTPRAGADDLLPSATPAVAAPTSQVPDRVLLAGVAAGKQAMSLSCEFQSASDLAWYYGKPYSWEEVFDGVGQDLGGNPHRGFAGASLEGPPGRIFPEGYGVYAEPIAEALRKFGLPAEVHYNEADDWLRGQLARGRPVMVWATAGMATATVVAWTAADGTPVKGARGEHTYLVIGYEPGRVRVLDPWDGLPHAYSWQVFVEAWGLFDRMSVVVADDSRGR